uniref:Uncharacterized protein n=1 Tax=Oryza meridionalis TaxID=40149 RepID=A0A0E0CSK5_9ORYZ
MEDAAAVARLGHEVAVARLGRREGGSRSGKGQRKKGFKIRKKKYRLCARDEQGAWACSEHRTMVKTTSLGREAILQVQKIIMVDYYCKLQKLGLVRWIAFGKQLHVINHLIDVINKLRRYKDRRLKCGLFYVSPHTKICDVVVHSRLYDMPLKEALTGSRFELKKREEILYITSLENQTSPSPLLYYRL